MFLKYARYWLKYNTYCIFKPYVSITPCSKNVVAYRFERTKFGFILWGRGKRKQVGWNNLFEGPCSYKFYKWMHGPTFAEDQTRWLISKL